MVKGELLNCTCLHTSAEWIIVQCNMHVYINAHTLSHTHTHTHTLTLTQTHIVQHDAALTTQHTYRGERKEGEWRGGGGGGREKAHVFGSRPSSKTGCLSVVGGRGGGGGGGGNEIKLKALCRWGLLVPSGC